MDGLRRLFVAVAPPPEARAALDAWIRPLAIPGRVVPVENWHITLRFVGQVDEVTSDRLLASLSAADLGSPFKVELGSLGAFPNPRRATVAWVAVAAGEDRLGELSEAVEDACEAAGLDPEERPFRSHLTVSRIRPAEDISSLVAGCESSNVGWRCDRVTVFESHLGRGHPRYEPLEFFELGR